MSESSQQPFLTLPITSDETLRKCRQMPVGPKDIFICSFPKSGTTWVQNIVFQLLSAEWMAKKSEQNPNLSYEELNSSIDKELPLKHISQYAPFLEIDPHWEKDSDQLISEIRQTHKVLGCRLFNTHLLWDMLPKNSIEEEENAKFIYVVRDGRDTLTSFYHHMTNQHPDDGGYEGDFQSFFQDFLDGKVAYGKWHHHLASWMPHICSQKNKENQQVLLVRYEDLKQDLKGQINRIADFLELKNLMEDQEKIMNRVLHRVSFPWMREHQDLFHPISVRWKPGYNFIRNGSVGDHDSIFNEEHKKIFVDSVVADLTKDGHVPDWLYQVGFHNDTASDANTTTAAMATASSVLRFASPSDKLSNRLIAAIFQHMQGGEQKENNHSNVFTISNRYFDAEIALKPLEIAAMDTQKPNDQNNQQQREDGILLVFSGSSETEFDTLASLHAAAESSGQDGDLLRLCIGIVNNNSTKFLPGTPEHEKEYARRVLWCLDRGYEYVEQVDLSENGLQEGHNDREKEGFARVIEALQGTVWSSARMHSQKKEQLRQSYQQTQQDVVRQPEKNAEEEGHKNPYKPPPTTLPIPATISCEEESQEREKKARAALLEQDAKMVGGIASNRGNDETQDEEEDQASERLFAEMEGTLKEANRIRNMSRAGELSDEDRRQRAGDAAKALMSLMNQMGVMEGSSEEEEDDDDN